MIPTDDSEEQNNADLCVEQKLQLTERSNDIYRQQLAYMEEHLTQLRSLIVDKQKTIDTLVMNYGGKLKDSNHNLDSKDNELKSTQKHVLENFDLRVYTF